MISRTAHKLDAINLPLFYSPELTVVMPTPVKIPRRNRRTALPARIAVSRFVLSFFTAATVAAIAATTSRRALQPKLGIGTTICRTLLVALL